MFRPRPLVCCAIVLSSAAFAVAQQSPPRDRRTEPVGKAVISGVVESDDPSPRPLRLATVRLQGDVLLTQRQVFTGDDGAFVFTGLPPGQYAVAAAKISYATTNYGERRPGGAGVPIPVGDGQHVSNLVLRLSRYGAISGTIYDPSGEPAQGVSVEALQYTMRTGRRSLSSVYGQPATTDDRGMYRIRGLNPGEYYIAAGPSPDDAVPGELVELSTSDVDRILQGAGPGAGPSTASSAHAVSYAPVFFPGSTDLGGASAITLTLGEDRTGVDVRLQLVPAARLEGTVVDAAGRPATSAQVAATMVTQASSLDLFRPGSLGAVHPDAQGRFVYPTMSPGHYVITARTQAVSASADGLMPATGPEWARAEITIAGSDQSLALTLQPGMTVTGRVALAGTHPPPATLTGVRISLVATGESSIVVAPMVTAVSAAGTFAFSDVPPGPYRISVAAPPGIQPWVARSAMVAGVDALDDSFDVKPNQDVADVAITLIDRPASLVGTLQAAAGNPTSDYFVIVFATDHRFWTPSSRRSVSARPNTAGRYVVANVPPGEYFVAAVTDVAQGEWYDPAFLESLVAQAQRVTIAEGEQDVLDLRIAGGS